MPVRPKVTAQIYPCRMEIATGGAWQLEEQMGPPDLIIRSKPYDVIANGQDQWWMPDVPFDGLDDGALVARRRIQTLLSAGQESGAPRPCRAGSGKPGSKAARRSVALARYGVGKSWEIYPEGTGMRVPTNGHIAWNLHYFPVGVGGSGDVVEVGLWFYPEGERPELETAGEAMFRVDGLNGMARGQDIVIPPHGYQVLAGHSRA